MGGGGGREGETTEPDSHQIKQVNQPLAANKLDEKTKNYQALPSSKAVAESKETRERTLQPSFRRRQRHTLRVVGRGYIL